LLVVIPNFGGVYVKRLDRVILGYKVDPLVEIVYLIITVKDVGQQVLGRGSIFIRFSAERRQEREREDRSKRGIVQHKIAAH